MRASRRRLYRLRGCRPGDQRAPACQEQPSLLTERDVSLTTTPDTEVLTQLIERGAEAGG